MNSMATILELAREIRHHIVSHSTGRLELTYSRCPRSVDFSNGTIVSTRDALLPCFEEALLEFSFSPMEIPPPTELQSGAAVLLEALESMNDRILRRVWEPYRDWTVLLPEHPRIHDTRVSAHLEQGGEWLRRMLNLAVTGSLTLGPPEAKSLDAEVKEIRAATGRGDYWQVLNIARSASSKEVKKAYRKRVRQFHPDRWYSSRDRTLKDHVEGAFRDVHYCYEQAMRALPQRPSAVTTPPRQETIISIVTRAAWERPTKPYVQSVVPHERETVSRRASKVASYAAIGMTGGPVGDSKFRRIFEKLINAA